MEDILIIAIQFLFEVVFDILFSLPFEWPWRDDKDLEREWRWLRYAGLFLFACAFGWLSLLWVQNALMHSPWLRILNLISAPLISAGIAQKLAKNRARTNSTIIPSQHYWQAFWVTLGFTLVRFAYSGH